MDDTELILAIVCAPHPQGLYVIRGFYPCRYSAFSFFDSADGSGLGDLFISIASGRPGKAAGPSKNLMPKKQIKKSTKKVKLTPEQLLQETHTMLQIIVGRLGVLEEHKQEVEGWSWDIAGKINQLAKPAQNITCEQKVQMMHKLNGHLADIIVKLVLMNVQRKHDEIKVYLTQLAIAGWLKTPTK